MCVNCLNEHIGTGVKFGAKARLQASCNRVGSFELSQCAYCERPVLSSVLPTVTAGSCKAVRIGNEYSFKTSSQLARQCALKATAAKDSATRASFEAERKQLLRLAEQAEGSNGTEVIRQSQG